MQPPLGKGDLKTVLANLALERVADEQWRHIASRRAEGGHSLRRHGHIRHPVHTLEEQPKERAQIARLRPDIDKARQPLIRADLIGHVIVIQKGLRQGRVVILRQVGQKHHREGAFRILAHRKDKLGRRRLIRPAQKADGIADIAHRIYRAVDGIHPAIQLPRSGQRQRIRSRLKIGLRIVAPADVDHQQGHADEHRHEQQGQDQRIAAVGFEETHRVNPFGVVSTLSARVQDHANQAAGRLPFGQTAAETLKQRPTVAQPNYAEPALTCKQTKRL